ncbi:MAG: glutaredoxin 3 [Thiotrichales bacterium]|nr:glutaredoxin 3 [Thiotrichales bacterium]
MPKVVIYLTRTCPFCNMAKRLLDSKGVSYEMIDIGNDRHAWAALEEKTGRNTVPQIFIGEHHVGGFDDLSAADRSGQLDQLLRA